jgi:hypothetical protein
MARIKIEDLPKDLKISKEAMKKIFGGPTRRMDIDHMNLSLASDGESTDDTGGSEIKLL